MELYSWRERQPKKEISLSHWVEGVRIWRSSISELIQKQHCDSWLSIYHPSQNKQPQTQQPYFLILKIENNTIYNFSYKYLKRADWINLNSIEFSISVFSQMTIKDQNKDIISLKGDEDLTPYYCLQLQGAGPQSKYKKSISILKASVTNPIYISTSILFLAGMF